MVDTIRSNADEDTRRTEFVHEVWPAQPQSLAGIRSRTRSWLAPLPLSEHAQLDFVVAVDEAICNVIKHAYGKDSQNKTVEITFWTEPTRVNIEIVDHGRWRKPSARPWSRGISLMHRMTDSVMIRFGDRGTRVLLSHSIAGRARVVPPGPRPPASLEVVTDGE